MKTARYYFLTLAVSFSLIVAYPGFFSSESHARSKWGKSGSYRSSWSKSGSYSKPSRSVWGKRSGGGIFGTSKRKTSTSGYAKPAGKVRSSGKGAAAGYSKPGSRSGTQKGRFFGGSSFDGKLTESAKKQRAKGSLSTYKTRQAGSTGSGAGRLDARRSSGGYGKPGDRKASTFGARRATGTSRASSGYAKPGTGSSARKDKFGGGSAFDRRVSETTGKTRAKRSLSTYKRKQTETRDRADYRTSRPGSADRGSVDDVIRRMQRARAATGSQKAAATRAGGGKSGTKFSGGYSGWSTRARPQEGKFGGGGAFDRKSIEGSRKQRAKSSLEAYKAEQNKFKKGKTETFRPEAYSNNRVYQRAGANRGFSYKDHYDRRDRYWRDRGYSYPSRMFGGRSSFGLWDAAFLYGLLHYANRPNAAAFAYHHQNDPGYQQWRLQANEQAKSDPEMRKQLAELDRQAAAMRAQGVKVNPAYLPEGVPPEMAVSAAALAAKSKTKPVLRLATGQQGGIYYEFGKLMKKAAKDLDVEVIVTAGSVENIELLQDGKADAALVQSDVLTKMPQKKTEQAVLYSEAIQLIANRKSGIKSVKDINAKKNTIYVGPRGSGTAVTWEGLCEQDKAYQDIPVKYASYKTALKEVATDPNALMLFVGGLNSPLLTAAEKYTEKTGGLRLAEVDDWDFNDKKDQHGNRIYTFIEIGKKTYPNLQKGMVFSRKIETLAVKAVFTVSTEWIEKHGPHVLDSLTMALKKVQPAILSLVHGK